MAFKKPKKNSLLHIFLDNEQESPIIKDNANEEETGPETTFFVDEEGRYYYQPTSTSVVRVEEVLEVNQGNPTDTGVLVDERSVQTVTLDPTENSNGELSCFNVLLIQEDPSVINLNTILDQEGQERSNDVLNFGNDEKSECVKKKKKTKRRPRQQLPCSLCPYTSRTQYLLLRHMRTHSQEKPHKCSECGRGFKTLAALHNHANMHNGIKPHPCQHCDSAFTTSGELVRHIRYRHTHEKPHKCTECDYASVELSKMRRHVRCHTGERPYQCTYCTYASQDAFKLKRHVRTHTGEKPYKCDRCEMAFAQSNSLKVHQFVHDLPEKPPYICELCPTMLKRKADFRAHVQNVHADMPCMCKRCGKMSLDIYEQKVHLKTHNGETQSGEKPFECTQCGKNFRHLQLLRRHDNLHHNPNYSPSPPKGKTFTCDECDRNFAYKRNLIRHMAIHDQDSEHHENDLNIDQQKKVDPMNGQPMEQVDDFSNKDMSIVDVNIDNGQIITGPDGMDYVVLDVIQMPDGTLQQITLPPNFVDEEVVQRGNQLLNAKMMEYIKNEEHRKSLEETDRLEKEVLSSFGYYDDESQDNVTKYNNDGAALPVL